MNEEAHRPTLEELEEQTRQQSKARQAEAERQKRRRKPKSANGPDEPIGPNGPEPNRATHQYHANRLDLACDAAEAVLAAQFRHRLLLYGGDLVEVARIPRPLRPGTFTPGVRAVTVARLRRLLGLAMDYQRYERRGQQWVARSVPTEVAENIIVAPELAGFGSLAGVTALPMIRPDGSIRTDAGFDPQTCMFVFEPPVMPLIPERPCKAEAAAALHGLLELLVGFPFADKAARAVAVSGLLSGVARPAVIGGLPLHLVTSPEAGSGKSYLCDLIAILMTGLSAYALSAGERAEETEKRLIAQLLAGVALVLLDNWNTDIGGDTLAQAITADGLALRPLGGSDIKLIENKAFVLANGLNPTLRAREHVRRTVHCRLDANSETPWLQHHESQPKTVLQKERGRFVALALTIIRWGLQNNLPLTQRYEQFADWDRMVRAPLIALGLADPLDSQEKLTVSTGEGQLRVDIFEAGLAELQKPKSAGQIFDAVAKEPLQHPKLLAALLDLGPGAKGGTGLPSRDRLGRWLAKNKDRIVNNIKLVVAEEDTHSKKPLYQFVATVEREP